MKYLVDQDQNFEFHMISHRKPMKFLEDWCYAPISGFPVGLTPGLTRGIVKIHKQS